MFIGDSEKRELDGIARNLANAVLDGEYSINEAVYEVMPFEYCLCPAAKKYVSERVQTITKLDVDPE
jgi:hypothetical protein